MKKIITIICAIFMSMCFAKIQTVEDCKDVIIENINVLENCKQLPGTYKFVNGKSVKSANGDNLIYHCSNGKIRIGYYETKTKNNRYLNYISTKRYVDSDTVYTQIGTAELLACGTFVFDDKGFALEDDTMFPNDEYNDNYDVIVEIYRKIKEKIKNK